MRLNITFASASTAALLTSIVALHAGCATSSTAASGSSDPAAAEESSAPEAPAAAGESSAPAASSDSAAAPTSKLTAADQRAPATEIKLKNLKGKRVKLSDFKGKVVVVNFWATWCVPCLQELPFLQTYYDQYKKDGLEILAITIDGPDTFARVRSVVKRRRWTMPILLDQDGSVAAELNPRGTNPFTIFVDRQGRVAKSHEGYSSGDETAIEAAIKSLLAEK